MAAAPHAHGPNDHNAALLDVDPREDETLRTLLLTSDTFARLVDDLPTGDTREMLVKWGEIRGLYPEAVTQAPGDRAQHTTFDLQPVGRPEAVSVSLDQDEVYETFYALLAAVQTWHEPEGLSKSYEAHRRLLQLCEALAIITRAYIHSRAPIVNALRADKAAARSWRLHRWIGRSRLQKGVTTAAEPAPQEKGE